MKGSSSERGETSAQVAIVAPVLFMCVFLVFHVAAYWMSALTASAAATRGARAASMVTQSGNARVNALAAVEDTVGELGSRLDGPPRIEIQNDRVLVSVTVRVPGLVSHLQSEVSRSVQMRLERFVQESGR